MVEEDPDEKDRKTVRNVLFGFMFVAMIGVIGAIAISPHVIGFFSGEFTDGLGFKDAAVWAFFVTLGLFVVLAVVAGDGLLGELQFLLSSFLIFFLIIWVMIAWIY